MWQLISEAVYRQGQVDIVGATSPHVNVETIRDYSLVAPPFDEQVVIADWLARECARYDQLVGEASLAVALLQERRTALISAAVTGKIDVRSKVLLPEPAPA